MPEIKQDIRTATFIVAANDSVHKNMADYVCPGINDHLVIQAALDALPATGGEVKLLDGTYNCAANLTVPASTTLEGQGFSTILNFTGAAITNAITLNGNNIHVKNLKAQLAAGAGEAGTRPNVVYASAKTLLWLEDLWIVGDTSVAYDGSENRECGILFITVTDSKVLNCRVEDNCRHGIRLASNSDNTTVSGNTCQGNTGSGIYLYDLHFATVAGNICQGNTTSGIYLSSAHSTLITGNTCQGNTGYGIYLNDSRNNTITGNTFQGNQYGIWVNGSSNFNTFVGNTCSINKREGIAIYTSNSNTISGNACWMNSQDADATYNNIWLGDSDYNLIIGNLCRDGAGATQPKYGINISDAASVGNVVKENDLYDSGRTAAFNDAGTDTATPEIYIPVQNPDASIGDHPALNLPDAADTTFRITSQVPLDFTQLVTAQVVIVPGGTGNMRRSVTTDWGKLPKSGAGTEAYNAGSDSIAAGEVAVTLNIVEGIDITTALDGIDIADIIGVAFTREGAHVNDTVGAACYALGLRVRYV